MSSDVKREFYRTVAEMGAQVESMRDTEEALVRQIGEMEKERVRAARVIEEMEKQIENLLTNHLRTLHGPAGDEARPRKYPHRRYPDYKLIPPGMAGIFVGRAGAAKYLGINLDHLGRLYSSGRLTVYKEASGSANGYKFRFSELEKMKSDWDLRGEMS